MVTQRAGNGEGDGDGDVGTTHGTTAIVLFEASGRYTIKTLLPFVKTVQHFPLEGKENELRVLLGKEKLQQAKALSKGKRSNLFQKATLVPLPHPRRVRYFG